MEIFLFMLASFSIIGNVVSFTKHRDEYDSQAEIVMEHDITLDEFTLMPFLKALLTKAGFARERSFADIMRNSVIGRRQVNNSRYELNRRYNRVFVIPSTKAVYETVSHCQKLKKSMRGLMPILSVLIRGGKRQAKLLAKKFSTKLPNKLCRAILTVHCQLPISPKVRSPRGKRV